MSLNNLEKGISVIIPTYKGEKYISKLLDSLVNQTINPELFDAIFIVNGEKDSTSDIIKEYQKNNPNLNIILTYSDEGVCNARNHGINISKREYTIFIDDDDFISKNYLETLYKYSKPNRVVVGTFLDINEDTGNVKKSYLSPPLLKKSGIIKEAYSYMPDILVITTDKLIPTSEIKKTLFNPKLKNGVDISYYARFYPKHDFEFYLVDKSEGATYYRLWRDNSISRQPVSYEFNVIGRLNVIKDINKGLKIAQTDEMRNFIKSLTGGQVNFINEYLKENPKDLEKVYNEINSHNFDFFPYKYLNEDYTQLNKENNELIISYAFPPTNTTTSNVVAKRIINNKNNVSVICGSLNDKPKDHEFEKIVNEFIIDKMTVNTDFNDNWESTLKFIKSGMKILDNKPVYDKIYSRSYFIPSNFLALAYKLKHPDIYWKAEFSDPLRYTPTGYKIERYIDKKYIEKINNIIPNEYPSITETDTLNSICEYLTCLFANKIIFTNENQKRFMLNYLPSEIREKINSKAIISPHPTLDKKYYYVKNIDYNIDKKYINFAYFGVIFGSRNFEDVINALDNLNEEYKDKFRLHLFTPNKTMFEQILSKNIFDKTYINSPISYLEFLNLTTKFDVLIVEDSAVESIFKINPYLPSKISDYFGSGIDIWAICEEESAMDKLNEITYKSRINDIESGKIAANKIMQDKLQVKISKNSPNKENTEEYLRNRINHLTTKIDELIQVAEEEFRKDSQYENEITRLNDNINQLKEENENIKSSNSWKITKPLRNITNKFK